MANPVMNYLDKIVERILQGGLKKSYSYIIYYSSNHTSDGALITKLIVTNLAEAEVQRWYIENAAKIPLPRNCIFHILQRVGSIWRDFSKYGKIECSDFKPYSYCGKYAFITFRDANSAFRARKDGCDRKISLHDRNLVVFPADSSLQPDETLIHGLNDDCLIHIFQYLPVFTRLKIQRVCKRWYAVVSNSWRSVRSLVLSYRKPYSGIYAHKLKEFLESYGRYIIDVEIPGTVYYEMSPNLCKTITECCPNVQMFDMSAIIVTPSIVASLARTYANLTDLILGKCNDCGDSDFKTLFENNCKLRKLKIDSNHKATGTCCLSLPDTLEELVLDMSLLEHRNLYNAIRRLNNLRILEIVYGGTLCTYDLGLGVSQNTSSLVVLKGIVPTRNDTTRLLNLKELDIEYSSILSDTHIFNIVEHCVNLISIDISNCREVSRMGVSRLLYLPNLQHFKMTDSCVRNFTVDKVNVPLKLKTFDCSESRYINNSSICDLIESAPCLELLNLRGCRKITDTVLDVAIKCTDARTNNIKLVMRMYKTSMKHVVQDSRLDCTTY